MKNIMIVDDTLSNIDILVELLSDQYTVKVALDGESALEIAHEEKLDLILLDIVMPEMDGYEVCQRLQADDKTNTIPIIFITAKSDEASIEKAYDIGGVDYISKPFKLKELKAKVRRELKMQDLICHLESVQEELRHLSSLDPMTKLYNRRYFATASDQMFNLSKRNKTPLSVIMLDVDKFKNFNDTHGHQVGDDLLIAFAAALQALTRKSDMVCRYGGEEFIILLPDTEIEGARSIAEKIRIGVTAIAICISDQQAIKFTVSVGISEVKHDQDNNIEASAGRADKAMYAAKRSGRNKVCSLAYGEPTEE